jgi:D-Tyr-tRNAtyr deacylase
LWNGDALLLWKLELKAAKWFSIQVMDRGYEVLLVSQFTLYGILKVRIIDVRSQRSLV